MNSSSDFLHPPCWDLEKLPCLLALFAYCLAQELFEQSWTVNAMITNLASSWHQGEKRFYLQLFWAVLASGNAAALPLLRMTFTGIHLMLCDKLWQGLQVCQDVPLTPSLPSFLQHSGVAQTCIWTKGVWSSCIWIEIGQVSNKEEDTCWPSR